MKLSVASSFIVALLGLILTFTTAADGQTTAAKPRKIPFHGTLQSADVSANTITLESKKEAGGRVFHVMSYTKITDGAGSPTTLASAVVGEAVGGSYSKDASGSLNLNSLRLGAKAGGKEEAATTAAPMSSPAPAAAPAPAPAPAPVSAAPAASTMASSAAAAPVAASPGKKQRFSGTVVSVDAASGTLVVHGKADQTFTVTAATKITGADGLGSVAPGSKVSGSYQRSADGGTLTVATLKVAK